MTGQGELQTAWREEPGQSMGSSKFRRNPSKVESKDSMKRAHCVIGNRSSWLAARSGAWIIGLAVVWTAVAPRAAWSQYYWPNYPYNSTITITSGGFVGIGTSNPLFGLDLEKNNGISAGNYSISWIGRATTSETGLIIGYHANGAVSDYPILRAGGYGLGLALGGDSANQAAVFIKNGGYVGIGTTNPQYLLSVKGVIGAQEVVVTNTGWSDYVFQPGYRLRPLREVGAYIRANRHLPDIPSEVEVKQKGVSVGEVQSRLLAKIEELTLHMIQAEERSDRLENQNRDLRERIARLEKAAAGATATH
jgi:hypothetical protein